MGCTSYLFSRLYYRFQELTDSRCLSVVHALRMPMCSRLNEERDGWRRLVRRRLWLVLLCIIGSWVAAVWIVASRRRLHLIVYVAWWHMLHSLCLVVPSFEQVFTWMHTFCKLNVHLNAHILQFYFLVTCMLTWFWFLLWKQRKLDINFWGRRRMLYLIYEIYYITLYI